MALGLSGGYAGDELLKLLAANEVKRQRDQALQMEQQRINNERQQQTFQQGRQTTADQMAKDEAAQRAAVEMFHLRSGLPSSQQPGQLDQQMNPDFVKQGLPTLPGAIGVQGGMSQPTVAPPRPGILPVNKTITPVNIPGIAGQPAIDLTPQTAEDVLRAKDQSFLQTPQKLSKDEQIVLPATGHVLASGAHEPDSVSNVSDLVGPQGEPVMLDPKGHQYLSTVTKQPVQPTFRPKEPTPRDPLAEQLSQARLDQMRGEAGQRNTAALDRSYNTSLTQLDAQRKPLADQADRLQRAVLAVNEASPQADALVAPMLLTAMAGGSGSGLRMNQAEINRIQTARSGEQSILAALNRWQLDPSKALQITPSQRQQMSQLLATMNSRLTGRLAVIDQAEQDLQDAPDIKTHRQIVLKAKKAMEGGESASPSSSKPQQPIPGIPGGIAEQQPDGRWLRVK